MADTGDAEGRGRRWRRISSWVLVVLACILAVLSVVVVFTRNQLLNTDTYVATVAPLASDPAIQTQVAKQVSANLIARTNVQQRVKDALPSRAGFLAAPLTSELQAAINQATLKAVQSPQFEKAWTAANRASHTQLVNLLTGSQQGALSSSNGKVTIDLSQVEVEAKKRLDARGITVFDRVPAVKGVKFVLFQSNQLTRIQGVVRFLNRLAVVLPIITVLCFAGGVALTRNRRRGLVRASTGLALSMALILVVLAIARNQYLASISPSQSLDANAAAIDIVTTVLRDTLRIILVAAALITIGAVLAGNSRLRAWTRTRSRPSWMAGGPVHSFAAKHRRVLQWGVLATGLLILVIWSNPTAFVAVLVLLIALAIIGLIGLFAAKGLADEAAGPTQI
jgi:hypothetical protein